jgi:hypothetical protein
MSMTMGNKMFEEFFQNIRKATEANLKLQQEAFRQWSSLWPGMPSPQPAWVNQVQQFQKQWSTTVAEMARKHQEVVEQQFKAALESLDAALRVGESTNPEEYRKRTEQLCRKTVECVREMTEAQVRELQDLVSKWSEMVTKAGS